MTAWHDRRVKLLARVEGDAFIARWCRLVRTGRQYQLQTRPRIALGELLAVSLPGCPAPSDDAIAAWLRHAYREPEVRVLRPTSFRIAVLADFGDALNATDHIAAARAASADEVAGFARDRGGALLAEIRGALDGDAALGDLPARARRFAMLAAGHPVAGEPGNEASRVLDELAGQHDVEHLLGLEHAVARWIAAAATPRDAELAALARTLPDDEVSAGISQAWLHWWWRLARACTRQDLMTIVDRAVDAADEQCTEGRRVALASEARVEARRMADRMRDAGTAKLWSEPRRAGATVVPDEDDAHYAAFMALTHAAHAVAHALAGQLGASDANRVAMRQLAELAVQFLREDPGEQ